ncbi:MAG: ABC transporter permease [Bacteroides sp.]|nr:ABC transporter permease [Eubacterium sp.]MCM1418302.1 ABC transporter permease [Roseburia sp.]MCM1462405.1 ABC transporter permease [Bacteroides sp.]
MKLKRWKNIFAFTFTQQIKTKSFIISTVIIGLIIAIIAATANILPAVFLEDEINQIESAVNGEMTDSSVSKLYIADRSGLSLNFSVTGVSLGVPIETIPSEEAEAKITELETTTENAMLALIFKSEDGYVIDAYYAGENADVKESDCSAIATLLSTQLQMQYLSAIGVPSEEISTAMSGVTVSLNRAGKEITSPVQDLINTVVPMVCSLVLFIFIFAYSQMIAQAIAIEKSSRVMEYLLTSVSPLSIIVGKVLAICLVSLMQFIILILAGAFGFLVSMPFGIFSRIDGLIAAAASSDVGANAEVILTDIQSAFSSVNIGTILVLLLTFILGFLLYALIAGLAGASISKMEDLSAAIQPMSIIGVLGFYLAYVPQVGAIDGETNAVMILARYLPISSPFCLPSAYMLGQIGFGEALLSLAFLLACVIALCIVVAKVYEHIVLYTGDRLKLADMFKMAKGNK